MSSAVLRRFSYRYPRAGGWALGHVDLDLNPGLTLITGHSGSGKSSLLRVLNGLVPHFHGGVVSGEARVAGSDVLRTSTRDLARTVGFLFQDAEMHSVYATVERDIAFGLENFGMARTEMIARVESAMDQMQITVLRDRAIATLSGGERQRVALAGLLAMRPSMLVLDEPLAQLDTETAEPLVDIVGRMAAGGTTVVVAEHRLDGLMPRADRVLGIDGGRIRAAEMASRWGSDDGGGRRSASRAHSASSNGDSAWSLIGATVGVGSHPVLHSVDIAAPRGSVTVLMGPNGSGKTTLLRTLAGLLPPLAGSVRRTAGRIAYLPQNPSALLHRPTVRSEVELTLRRAGDAEPADAILGELGLVDVAGSYPRDLSTGQRQRAAIAAVLAGAPNLALLDEPTRGMDGAAREALLRLVRRIVEHSGTVVLATHDADLATAAGDRILRLEHGTVRDTHLASAVEPARMQR